MKRNLLYPVIFFSVALAACQKEQSFESGYEPGSGSLQEDVSGDCFPKTVNGVYEANVALSSALNNITVDVDVTKTGTYTITTDTINGVYFNATGTFTTLGVNTITLRGHGTPFSSGVHNFVVSYDGTSCDVQVTTVPEGGGNPAEFTIETSGTTPPLTCSGASALGNYIIGSPLNSTNRVILDIDVTAIGTYNVTTTAVNGITFSGSGAFLTTGAQNLVLYASGTPTGAAGTLAIPVTAGSSTCEFAVTTVAGAELVLDCAGALLFGNYTEGAALNAAHAIHVPVNIIAPGPYNITASVNGMTFIASGSFASPGPHTITLNGSGTPISDGTFNLPLPGTVPCVVAIEVEAAPAPAYTWEFKIGSTLYQGTTVEADIESQSGATTLNIFGEQTGGISGDITLAITNVAGGIGTGSYSGTGGTRIAFFTYTSDTEDWMSLPSSGTNLSIQVTTYNTTTKIIEGIFSGTVKNFATNATATISSGKFKASLP